MGQWYQSLPCRPGFVVGSGGCGWPGHCLSCLVLSWKKEIHLQSFLPLQSALVSTSGQHRPWFSPPEHTGPGFSAFKASTNQPAQKNATSDVISPKLARWFTDQIMKLITWFTDQESWKCVLQNSRLLWFQCLSCSPCLVVGSGVLWTVRIL